MPASSWEDQTRSIKKSNSWNFRVLRNIQRRWLSTSSKGLTVQGRKVHSPTESVCYSMEDESSKWLTHEKKVPARELRTEYQERLVANYILECENDSQESCLFKSLSGKKIFFNFRQLTFNNPHVIFMKKQTTQKSVKAVSQPVDSAK